MRSYLLSCTLLCSLQLLGCAADQNGPLDFSHVKDDASARPEARTLDAGHMLDAGRTLDAGQHAMDGAPAQHDAGRIVRHGPWDPEFPVCNSPACIPERSLAQCESTADCCQVGGWSSTRICLAGFCGYPTGGFEPEWHDPLPVCTGDAGTASR